MIHFNKNSLYTLGLSISPLIISNFCITEIPSFNLILPLRTKKRGWPKGCQYNVVGIQYHQTTEHKGKATTFLDFCQRRSKNHYP